MVVFFSLIKAFLFGGIMCFLGQLFSSKSLFSNLHISAGFLVFGVFFGVFGLFETFFKWGQAGVFTSVFGLGYLMGEGTKKLIEKIGFLGIFSGSFYLCAAQISVAIFLGFLLSIFFKTKKK